MFAVDYKSKVRLMKEDIFQERETNRQLKSGGGKPITSLPKSKYNCNLREKAHRNACSIDYVEEEKRKGKSKEN